MLNNREQSITSYSVAELEILLERTLIFNKNNSDLKFNVCLSTRLKIYWRITAIEKILLTGKTFEKSDLLSRVADPGWDVPDPDPTAINTWSTAENLKKSYEIFELLLLYCNFVQ